MRLSDETHRVRWLILACAWAVVALIAAFDARAVRDYVALLDDSGTLAADSIPLRRSAPADYADAQTWTRLALELEHRGAWRLRHTDIDNAPLGREVYWNSAFARLVAGAGRIRRSMTGEALPTATERSLAWFNFPLLMAVVIFFSSWTARRAGAAAGVLVAMGMIGHRWFYDGFAPNYVDHHGLLAASSLGVVLGAVFMGAGWWRANADHGSVLPESREVARRGVLLSAISGGIGLWISAASAVPTIAIVGFAGFAAALWHGRNAHEEGARFDGDLWRLWGRVGALVSLVAWCIENVPDHIATRLEVNHPLYALAWLGAAELIAALGEWRVVGARVVRSRMLWAIPAFVLAPIMIVSGGSRVFIPLDSRMSELHRHIGEFHSIFAFVGSAGTESLGRFIIGFALALPIVVVAWAPQKYRLMITFVSIVVAAYVAMAAWQIRWWLGAGAAELALLLVAVATVTANRSARTRWVVVLVLAALFVEQAVVRVRITRHNVDAGAVTAADARQPVYRDIAVAVRASHPAGDVVLLASPNASTGIGYFGGFKTIGTLYWENFEGLAAAAAIFSAPTDADARALMRARGVTHVVLVLPDDFPDAFLTFVRLGVAISADQTFGHRLRAQDTPPRWLRPVPYRPRPGGPGTVRIFQVVPDQTELESLWSNAAARAAAGDLSGAEHDFTAAVTLAPADRQAALYESAGAVAYRWQAHTLAIRLFGAAMSLDPASGSRVTVAWILATSTDDSVRDGRTALAVIEPLVRNHPNDPGMLDVLAAALAETGRFPEAAAVAQRVVSMAQAGGDAAAQARATERLRSYAAGRPWRQ